MAADEMNRPVISAEMASFFMSNLQLPEGNVLDELVENRLDKAGHEHRFYVGCRSLPCCSPRSTADSEVRARIGNVLNRLSILENRRNAVPEKHPERFIVERNYLDGLALKACVNGRHARYARSASGTLRN
jgi:hypothetical protein